MGLPRDTRDQECVRLLRWALPRLGYRWGGFRKVRRQICRRLQRRRRELGLPDFAAYRHYLEAEAGEWQRFDQCCRVTISRFHRDVGVWRELVGTVLPELGRSADGTRSGRVRIWCAGAGAGEEPYTLVLSLALGAMRRTPGLEARIIATDIDPGQLERARRAVYPESSLRDLPPEWRKAGFEAQSGGDFRLRPGYRAAVEFRCQDLRREAPRGPFDLVLCRNLAFTYFEREQQRRCLERILRRLEPGGWLVVGSHESPPAEPGELAVHERERSLWRRLGA